MNEQVKYGLIAVSLLGLLGSGYVFTEEQLSHSWYCDKTESVYAFERMSSTNKTGYWTVDGVEKQKTCTLSKWIPLREYCKSQGLFCTLQSNDVLVSRDTGRYLCNTIECDRID
jgi:hypothetical protein